MLNPGLGNDYLMQETYINYLEDQVNLSIAFPEKSLFTRTKNRALSELRVENRPELDVTITSNVTNG